MAFQCQKMLSEWLKHLVNLPLQLAMTLFFYSWQIRQEMSFLLRFQDGTFCYFPLEPKALMFNEGERVREGDLPPPLDFPFMIRTQRFGGFIVQHNVCRINRITITLISNNERLGNWVSDATGNMITVN